jgi:hypothetical protein
MKGKELYMKEKRNNPTQESKDGLTPRKSNDLPLICNSLNTSNV